MKTVKHLLAFLMIILLSVFLCSCSQSAKAHAEKAIKKDLDLLKNLDSETTMQYISYQELFPDSDDSTKLSADIKEVFSLFFQNFDYKILGISVDSDEKNASDFRIKACQMFAEKTLPNYNDNLLQFADMLRMEGDFNNAIKVIDAVKGLTDESDDKLLKIINAEKDFIQNKDKSRHNLGEIFG